MTHFIPHFSYAAEAVIAIAALFGNIVVISCFLRFSELRTITNKYILNLSIACLGSSTTTVIYTIHAIEYKYNWQLGEILCKLFMATMFMHYLAISIFLVILCVDRYLVIDWPASRTRVISNIVMTAAWIASALLAIPLFMYTGYEERYIGNICYETWPARDEYNYLRLDVGNVYYLILTLVVPLILIVIFNILVARKLKIFGNFNRSSQIVVEFNRLAADGDDVNGSVSVFDQSNMAAQVEREVSNATNKVSIHVIVVTAIWTLCMISYAMCFVFYIGSIDEFFGYGMNFYYTTYFFSVTLTMYELLLPTLYALLNDNYRKCVWKLFTCAAVGDDNAL